ncbi:MAG: ribonuclease HII [Bacillota bacterium]
MFHKGYKVVCGVDEAGRGPIAGPVVVGAVVLEPWDEIQGVDDSKRLTPHRREELYMAILRRAKYVSVGICGVEYIDRFNVLEATYDAARQALRALGTEVDCVISDALRIPGIGFEQIPVIRGDATCHCVAAASIVAKVVRDRLMLQLDQVCPGYGLAQNKGYGTREHYEALRRLGPSLVHRRSFRGVVGA